MMSVFQDQVANDKYNEYFNEAIEEDLVQEGINSNDDFECNVEDSIEEDEYDLPDSKTPKL